MPYFSWHGVDLRGKTRVGKLFARSEQELDGLLLKRDIALLGCKTSTPLLLRRSISLQTKLYFFRELSVLLSSGVLLPDALNILSHQIDHAYFQEIICQLADAVNAGMPLSDAMLVYPRVFNDVMITMVRTGQESGSLAISLIALTDYFETIQQFRKRLVSAAMGPLFTLGFFVVVAAVIFVGIIPRFATLFASADHDLPSITKTLIAFSSFVSSWRMLVLTGIMALLLLVVRSYFFSDQGTVVKDRWVLRMPFVGPLTKKSCVVYFLRSLALLLKGGVPLVSALTLAKSAVTNTVVQGYIQDVCDEVEAGSSLSQAMATHQEELFEQNMLAVVHVGEESGTLTATIARLADHYQAAVQRTLTIATVVLQPFLMIVLGLLVTLLILAVYLPIFNLAQVASY